MNRIWKHKIWIVAIVVLAVALVFSGELVRRAVAQDAPSPEVQDSESSNLLAEVEYTCTIANVTVYANRIHVRCTAAPPLYTGITYFASANDGANIRVTNQYLLLLNTAVALNKTVGVRFEGSSSENPPGCAISDCRKIVGIFLWPTP